MKKILRRTVLMALTLGVLVGMMPRTADAEYYLYSRKGATDLTLGLGMLVRSPVRFDLQVAGEYFLQNNVSLGLSFDSYLRGPNAFSFRPFARYHFDISQLPKFVPYVGVGLGGGVDTHSNGFMDILVPNFGFKYALTRNFQLGSDFGLHIFTDFDSSRVDFHILFLTIGYRF